MYIFHFSIFSYEAVPENKDHSSHQGRGRVEVVGNIDVG